MADRTLERVKEAVEEADAMDLPDGAWLEWVAERAGLGPGNGYEVATLIAENPEFFGWKAPE